MALLTNNNAKQLGRQSAQLDQERCFISSTMTEMLSLQGFSVCRFGVTALYCLAL